MTYKTERDMEYHDMTDALVVSGGVTTIWVGLVGLYRTEVVSDAAGTIEKM